MKKYNQLMSTQKLFIILIIFLSLTCPININGQINYLDAINPNNQIAIQMIISPDGKFAYVVTNGSTGEIQTYQRNSNNGQLTFLSSLTQMSAGIPLYMLRNLAISPDAKFVYSQGTANTFVFNRDTITGLLTPFQTLPIVSFSSNYPSINNIVVSNDGQYIYISRTQNLFIYKRNSITGNLSLINTMLNLNNIPSNYVTDISILLSSDNRLAFITGGNSVSTYLRDTLTGNLTFKNIISGNNFINQGLTYAIESVRSANDNFLYTITGSMGNGALNVLKKDTLTDSLSVIQTLYINRPQFINISNAKKFICVSGYDLVFYEIDSISGMVQYFSTFHDSISNKYYGKKCIDNNSKYFYSTLDSIFRFQIDFAVSVSMIISEKNKISIYPNPFSSNSILQTTAPVNNATLTLANCLGETVKQIINISGHTIILHRENLPSGLYVVKLTQDNKTIFADKLIIVD